MQKDFQIKNVSIQLTLTLNIKIKNLQVLFFYKEQIDQIFKELKTQPYLVKNGESWTNNFKAIFDFTKPQVYRISVDNDTQGSLGSVSFFLGNLVRTGTWMEVTKYFTITLQVTLLQWGNTLFWQWAGQKLLNTDGFFGKSDPFLQFFIWDDGQWILVHQTEFIEDNLNPVWMPFTIDMGLLNYGDVEKNFKIECLDNSKKNPPKHKFIGRLEKSYTEISNSGNKVFSLSNPDHVYNNINQKYCGDLNLLSCQLDVKPNFIKLLQKIQIQAIFIIQLTKQCAHLHSLSHENQNIYQQLIISLGSILIQYNQENTLQMYGIGGISNNQINHHYLISKGQSGIQGICQDYAKAVKEALFGEQTQISSSLFEFVKQVEMFKPNFTVGLVILHEEMFDMEQFNQFLSHQINLHQILIVIALQNMKSIQEVLQAKELNKAQVHFITLKELNSDIVQEVTKSIMELIQNAIQRQYL